MIKRLIQQIAPSPLLNFYKKRQFYRTIKNFQIEDEPDLLIARKLVSPKDTILDIGANIGLYIHFLSPLAKRIIAFEPVPFTFSVLQNNADLFGWKNIELHQEAISEKDGEAIIEIPVQAGVRNYFRATLAKPHEKSASDMTYKVQTRSLDSLFVDSGREISLIKCDTEGHELSVIKGAQQFLQQHKPAWLIEVSGDPEETDSNAAELCSILQNFGYETYLFENNIFRKRESGDQSINYFFLQHSHIERLKNSNVEIFQK